ncbi:hypothetical protein [Grimontia sp. NTOU-MAR1]|uniref:hypothetical protein n=1 Tax=Grimontia sp. NTOU-MAR1 TaxID=3111011 RepID=UPI002DB70108|nr:hypothetical protein [Grimontia sp. NTOU-MAR1]WRV99618.1 hypothetical protein VP504_21740 [Grimontia sp. NTOU-MAR1]
MRNVFMQFERKLMPYRNNNTFAIFNAFAQFLFLAVLVSLPVLVIRFDIDTLKTGASEGTLVEYMEQFLLSLTVLCYAYIAKHNPSFKRFGALVIGFFLCLLIRELDMFFDELVFHGFWVYPAAIVAASAVIYSLTDRVETANQFAAFVNHRNFGLLCMGLAMLLVFSRLFGMSSLWRELLGDGYVRAAKNIAEEGTELMAYVTIFYASLRYVFAMKPAKDKSTHKSDSSVLCKH